MCILPKNPIGLTLQYNEYQRCRVVDVDERERIVYIAWENSYPLLSNDAFFYRWHIIELKFTIVAQDGIA